MKKQTIRRRPWFWFLPLVLALPFVLGAVWVAREMLPQVEPLLQIALKAVILP